MDTISELFEYYIAHQDEFVAQYNGKYIVLTKDGIQGSYDNEMQGYYEAEKKFGLGNFILQLCTPGDSAYTVSIYSPVFSF